MSVLNGVRLTSADMTYGNIPFIGATDNNNGITNWTNNTNTSTDKNVLGINYNGSVGEVFYHPYTATFSDDVKRLRLKNSTSANKEIYLFIKTLLLQQKNKYTYGYKFNGTRMKAQKIMLPVMTQGSPNWDYMEQYIVNIIDNIEVPDVSLPVATSIKLDSVIWKPYLISDLFDVNKEPGSENNMAALKPGNTPLISARKFDNGLKGLVLVDKKKIKSANTITWNKDGDGGAGLAYYQPFEYAVDSHVFVLYPKFKEINKYCMLFITPLLSQYKDIFGHGLANNKKRFEISKILLPVTSDNRPNWQFMEEYIKSISNSRLI